MYGININAVIHFNQAKLSVRKKFVCKVKKRLDGAEPAVVRRIELPDWTSLHPV